MEILLLMTRRKGKSQPFLLSTLESTVVHDNLFLLSTGVSGDNWHRTPWAQLMKSWVALCTSVPAGAHSCTSIWTQSRKAGARAGVVAVAMILHPNRNVLCPAFQLSPFLQNKCRCQRTWRPPHIFFRALKLDQKDVTHYIPKYLGKAYINSELFCQAEWLNRVFFSHRYGYDVFLP